MRTSSDSIGHLRIRWAAIGAAIAIILGGGGIGLVSASVSSGERSVLIAITSCRVVDVRPDFQIGPKSTPLGPNETMTVSAHGDNGNCTDIPDDAVALSLNVTALDATTPTFLTISAAGVPRPIASSLNPSPGAPPTPNAVTTELSSGGQFNVFNRAGLVNVFVDITGYYVDHDHDDRYDTKSQVNSKVAAATAETEAQLAAATAETEAQLAAIHADTNAKIAAASLDPTVIDIGIFEMFPEKDADTAWVRDSVYTHNETGTGACLVFPIEPIAGQTITGMSVSALSTSSTQLLLGVRGLRSSPGPFADVEDLFHYVIEATGDLPKSPVNMVSAVTVAAAPDALVREGFTYSGSICAIAQVTVTGVQVTLSNP